MLPPSASRRDALFARVRRHATSTAVVLLAGLLSPSGAGAQQPPALQESVIVTATMEPEPVGTVGRSVTVLTGEDVRLLPLSSLHDALRLAPGVDVRPRGPLGLQADFSLRGAAFGQALVLVDGVRINDAQSGHHNSDIPVPLQEIERIEVLLGGGSSLHGADATGGTINVVTRRRNRRDLVADLSVGGHGLVEASAVAGVPGKRVAHVVSGTFSRSGGFMPARDHDAGLLRYQASVGANTTAAVGFLDKHFGANGFYGPAPSREWTDQLLASVHHRHAGTGRWYAQGDASFRTHGDRFVYDERTPALSDNRHRTHAVGANVRWHGPLAPRTRVSIGAGGGHDTIASTNLGDRAFARGFLAAEIRHDFGSRLVVHPGIRFDAYSRFGSAWSPAVSASAWASDRLRLRASASRGFRVPTFTELYYTDPNHQGAGALQPETASMLDLGGDLFGRAWTAGTSLFWRREQNVIDWVRPDPAVRWRTANIRTLSTRGLEVSLGRRLQLGRRLGLHYTWLASDAPALELLSKYVLDYARHSVGASGVGDIGRTRVAGRAEWKRRTSRPAHWTVDLKVSRSVGRSELYMQVTNVFDERYQEIGGVDMPGRWLKAGITLRFGPRGP